MSNQESPSMPKPTAEHRLLKDHAGTWNVACKFYMAPGEPPMEAAATDRIDMIGEFWTVSRYETQMMGAPFVGSATLGFEPHSKQFVSTWIDSMAPVLCTLRGEQKGDTITMKGEFFSQMTQSVLKHRSTEKHVSKNERIFELFVTLPDGKELKMMTNHYRRA